MYMHCILICFINTTRFQIIYSCIDVTRHSSERINRLLIIYSGKIFAFRTNQLSTKFFWGELPSTSEVPLYIKNLWHDITFVIHFYVVKLESETIFNQYDC